MAAKAPLKLSEEQKEAAVKRLYEDEMRLKNDKKKTLEKKIYKEEAPKTISVSQLEESVSRQYEAEVKRREAKAKELKNKYYKAAEPHKLPQEEIEGSVQRIYADAMRHKTDRVQRLEAKYTFKRKEAPKLSSDVMKESSNRLSKPKKTDFSEDEINRIYGF
eukprot:Sspe_Gene.74955::Locus_46839_Transcript_1_1_Confidence_1.000_Length_571::g.74955::m.74955